MAIRFQCDNPSCGQTMNHRGSFFVYIEEDDFVDKEDYEDKVAAMRELVSGGCPQCGGYVIVAKV